VPDVEDPIVQALVAFRSLLLDPRPTFHLRMLQTRKDTILNAISGMLDPTSAKPIIARLEYHTPEDIKRLVFDHAADQHFQGLQDRPGVGKTGSPGYKQLEKWLYDPRAFPILSSVYDRSTICPAVLPEVCRISEFIRVGVGRAWIRQSTFVFVAEDYEGVRRETSWLRAFLAHFPGRASPFALLHTICLPYWSSCPFAADSKLDIVRECALQAPLRTLKLGIQQKDLRGYIDSPVSDASIWEYIELSGLCKLFDQDIKEVVLVKGVLEDYPGFWITETREDWDLWTRKIGAALHKGFMHRNRKTRIYIDWDSDWQTAKDDSALYLEQITMETYQTLLGACRSNYGA